MRVLVCIAAYTHAKDYVLPDFEQMMEGVLAETEHEVDLLWCSDDNLPQRLNCGHLFKGTDGFQYSDDMLPEAHEYSLGLASDYEYDKLVWQGVDALYQKATDFDALVESPRDVIAPLISARQVTGMAVARRFYRNGPGGYSQEQYEIPKWELLSGRALIRAGFPSADNLVIDRRWFHNRIGNFVPWYRKVAEGKPNMCYEEEWCWRVLQMGGHTYVNPYVTVWHVDDDPERTARLWPDVESTLDEIAWWR